MTNQTFDFEAITDYELEIAYDGLKDTVAGGFTDCNAGLMANAVDAGLPPTRNLQQTWAGHLARKADWTNSKMKIICPALLGLFMSRVPEWTDLLITSPED